MERDLYAVVRRGSTHRRDWRMWAALCLVLALPLVLWLPETLGRRRVKEA